MSLFNGRRIVFCVTGPGLAPLDAVQRELEGCDVTWLTAENNPVLKEYVGFPHLLRSLQTYNGLEDVTFYGHGKGVASSAWGPGVQRWAESMYSGLLDYWPAVQRELTSHPCVGVWRKRQGWAPINASTWHYAGSFRWVRNRDMYSRRWDDYIVDWVCPEAHVGGVFSLAESGCLYGDSGSSLFQLYGDDWWASWAQGEKDRWEAAHTADRVKPQLCTVILTAHSQIQRVHDAIHSVLAQSCDNWQLLIMDSGRIAATGAYQRYAGDARIHVELTGETAAQRETRCMQGWAINQAWKRGLVRGDLVMHLSDDDVYAPDHVEVLVRAARENPEQQAWYRGADRVEVLADGQERVLGELPTCGVGQTGHLLAGRVDGMQVAHRRAVRQPWPERRADAPLADGVWMDALASTVAIYPLTGVCGRHRHTPESTFTRPAG